MIDPWGKTAHLSKGEILALQNRKLYTFINQYLYPFSDFYQDFFKKNNVDPRKIRTVEDLQRIPFTSKADFLDQTNPNKLKQFILHPDLEKIKKAWPADKLLRLKLLSIFKGPAYVKELLGQEFRPTFITFTTGTTSDRISFLYTGHDIKNLSRAGSRLLNVLGIKDDDHLINMFPFAPHLAFWQVVLGGLTNNVLILSTGGGKVMSTDGNIAVMEKMLPRVIVGVPGYIYHVLREAKQRGHSFDFVKKVVLGASRVTPEFKTRVIELLQSTGSTDVDVLGTYGFTEAKYAWAECPAGHGRSTGYHLYPDMEIFEIIDPKTGEVKKEGEDGEIVYTSLDARGSCVLRFRTGDFVKGGITYEPCPYCGKRTPRLSSDITRISDIKDIQISKIKGSLVNFNTLAATLCEFGEVEEWQIEISKKDDDPFEVDQLVIYVSVREGVDRTVLSDMLKNRLLVTTEVTPNEIKFIPLNEMVKRLELDTANKEKRIIDRRPHGG